MKGWRDPLKKLTADDPETKSPDLVAHNIEELKRLFPEAFTEGKIDFDVLKQLLGGNVDEREEKYGLNWYGKRAARQLALTPSTGTLRPAPEESVDWETTKNLMIEGDNLEVLKLLEKSYAGEVKMIYIDPPYNTGGDFVYPDDFHESIENYLMLTQQIGSDGRRISSNTEGSGRLHTSWLNMMSPRVKRARNFLTEDGFLVVSIDDAELQNLRAVLDEVMGRENFVATLVFDRNRKNDASLFSVGHEYMVVYAKNKSSLTATKVRLRSKKEGVEDIREEWERLRSLHGNDWSAIAKGLRLFYATFEEDDPRLPLTRFKKVDENGPYRTDGDASWPGGGGPRYDVPHPVTGLPCAVPGRGWVWSSYERMKEEIDRGNVIFGEDETTIPSIRRNLFDADDQVMRSVVFSYAQKASQDFVKLFDGSSVFDNPKSYVDLERLVNYLSNPGDIVMDFFAGSGTTGHAVMLSNRTASVPRRYILVQFPEPLSDEIPEQVLATQFCDQIGRARRLTEVTKERLRRAATRISGRGAGLHYDDLGFRVFKLASSNIRAWEPNRDDMVTTLDQAVENLRKDRTDQDILFELLLKLGLDLSSTIERRKIAGHDVHGIGAGTLIVCLANAISAEDVEALALGIAAWRTELDPAGDTTVVFRDSAFADDVAKTNITAILDQNGIKKIRSL